MLWERQTHSANFTDDYVFHQLIPYIGNKRKLLGLIDKALLFSGIKPETGDFVDLFAGTGVVSRFAKQKGYRVICNDWEPYSESLNHCAIAMNHVPVFGNGMGYHQILDFMNHLPPIEGWVTQHLCPDDDSAFDIHRDRMFYMRKNGMRIDAMREQIAAWEAEGWLDMTQKAALLAPLLYQCCYNSNTSGVFKGFHNGWGGQTGTALYRIQGVTILKPAVFHDNGQDNQCWRMDAAEAARHINRVTKNSFVYLDPPYNQHPYGANYHVLNSVALWDKPQLSPKISGHGDKSAIRTDWRTERRSAYNYRAGAVTAYRRLIGTLQAKYIATSYSTDGMIDLESLVKANLACGNVTVFAQPYKRYRVSSQRYSPKPRNVEFILLTEPGKKSHHSCDDLVAQILNAEKETPRISA